MDRYQTGACTITLFTNVIIVTNSFVTVNPFIPSLILHEQNILGYQTRIEEAGSDKRTSKRTALLITTVKKFYSKGSSVFELLATSTKV